MRLLTAAQLGEMLGLSRRHIYRLDQMGRLPKSFLISPGTRRWVETEIEDFVREAPRSQVGVAE